MKREISANQKVTLTLGQLKKLVRESDDEYLYLVYPRDVMDSAVEEIKNAEWFGDCDWEPGESEEDESGKCTAVVNTGDGFPPMSFKITIEEI